MRRIGRSLMLGGLAATLWAGADPHPSIPPMTVFMFGGASRASTPDGIDADPYDLDANGNGLPDAWETDFFGATPCDPTADPDGDGVCTHEEYWSGRHPTLPDREADSAAGRLRVFTP